MPLTSTYTTISSGQTDADSPLDTVLFEALRQNIQALYESQVGDTPTYTLSTAHNHNGVNSAPITAPDSSLGDIAIATHPFQIIQVSSNNSPGNKVWEGVCPRSGSYRVTFASICGSGNFQMTLNKNGTAIASSSDSVDGTTHTINSTGWAAGDLMQIFHWSNGANGGIQNIKIGVDSSQMIMSHSILTGSV